MVGACGAEEEKLVRGLAAQEEGCGLSKAACSLGGEVTLTNSLLDVKTEPGC